MSNTTYIYGLVDPRDGQVRYVGKSDRPLNRMKSHLSPSGLGKRRIKWLRSLKELGLKPKLRILEECSKDGWRDRERHWILHYTKEGASLTNGHIGTGGRKVTGLPVTLRQRSAIREFAEKYNLPYVTAGRALIDYAIECNPSRDDLLEATAKDRIPS